MKIKGKRLRAASEIFSDEALKLSEALDIVAQYGASHAAKFDETVEIAFRLGIDPKHSDQMVRGSVPMPSGLGKKVRVWAFVDEADVKAALDAGADKAGLEDLIAEVEENGVSFDRCIATPSVMPTLAAKLGKLLGRQRMMPSPKLGTVGADVAAMVSAIKMGSVEFKSDKTGIVHAPVGKVSFGADKLRVNIAALYNALMESKPKAVKKAYIESVSITTTQGSSQKISKESIAEAV